MLNGRGNDNQGISNWDLYHIAGARAVVRRSINNALYSLAVETVKLGAKGLSAIATGVYHVATIGAAYIQEKVQAQPLPAQGTVLAKYFDNAGVNANYHSDSDEDYAYSSSEDDSFDEDNSPRPRRRM